MKACECRVTPEIKTRILEAFLARGRSVRIKRKKRGQRVMKEDWRIDHGLLENYIAWHRQDESSPWTARFGYGAIEVVASVVWQRRDCRWIFPVEGLEPGYFRGEPA